MVPECQETDESTQGTKSMEARRPLRATGTQPVLLRLLPLLLRLAPRNWMQVQDTKLRASTSQGTECRYISRD